MMKIFREFEGATTAEENVEGKKVYVCKICGQECVSSIGFKRHETLKHTREGTFKTAEKPKKTVSPTLRISQFQEIIKECAKLCHGNSCLPEDIRICLIPLNLTGNLQLIYGKFWSQLLQNFMEMQKNFIVLFIVYCKIIYCPINLVEILP